MSCTHAPRDGCGGHERAVCRTRRATTSPCTRKMRYSVSGREEAYVLVSRGVCNWRKTSHDASWPPSLATTYDTIQGNTGRESQVENFAGRKMVGPGGLEPLTSSVSTYHP